MRHVQYLGRVILSAGVVVGSSVSALAGSCGHEYCWGAVGAGDNGFVAHASGLRTAPGAMARLSDICGTKCKTQEIFHSGCAVIAETFEREHVVGFAKTEAAAEAEALALCKTKDDRSCRVRVRACSR